MCYCKQQFGMQSVHSNGGGALTVVRRSFPLRKTIPLSLAHTGDGRAEASEVN